jgi:hypothetical protein
MHFPYIYDRCARTWLTIPTTTTMRWRSGDFLCLSSPIYIQNTLSLNLLHKFFTFTRIRNFLTFTTTSKSTKKHPCTTNDNLPLLAHSYKNRIALAGITPFRPHRIGTDKFRPVISHHSNTRITPLHDRLKSDRHTTRICRTLERVRLPFRPDRFCCCRSITCTNYIGYMYINNVVHACLCTIRESSRAVGKKCRCFLVFSHICMDDVS